MTKHAGDEPTEAMVAAAAKGLAAYDEWGSWEAVPGDFKDQYRDQARAALVAAQGAAPQAEIHEPNHDRVYCVRCGGNWPCQPAPVLPSSGVDEAALAEVMGSHRISHLGQCECGHVLETYGHHNHEPEEIMEHLAREVAAWLKDGAR